MTDTFNQQLAHFPGCEPTTVNVELKAYAPKAGHSQSALKRGLGLDAVIFRTKLPTDYWQEVGVATIQLQVYAEPITEPRSVQELVAARAEVLRRADEETKALTRKINAMAGATEYLPTERELDDVLDMQRTEPRSEAWKRGGKEA